MESDNLPWNYAGAIFLGIGKSPFANKTIAIFFYLSAQTYDPLVSDNPNECWLNFLPHGGFEAGTESHPLVHVLLYFFYGITVVYAFTIVYSKTFVRLSLPLFNINCI